MDVPLIEQVKIQAQVLVPLVKALQAELGEERANAIVRKALGDQYRKYGEKWWRSQGARNLGEKVASAFEMFAAGDALEYKVVKKTPDALELTCSADTDFFHAEGFSANVRLTVTQTIMQGASQCGFRYALKKNEKDTVP